MFVAFLYLIDEFFNVPTMPPIKTHSMCKHDLNFQLDFIIACSQTCHSKLLSTRQKFATQGFSWSEVSSVPSVPILDRLLLQGSVRNRLPTIHFSGVPSSKLTGRWLENGPGLSRCISFQPAMLVYQRAKLAVFHFGGLIPWCSHQTTHGGPTFSAWHSGNFQGFQPEVESSIGFLQPKFTLKIGTIGQVSNS